MFAGIKFNALTQAGHERGGKLAHRLTGFARVDAHPLNILRPQIAQCAHRQTQILVDHRFRACGVHLALNLLPQAQQIIDIMAERFFAGAFTGSAHNKAELVLFGQRRQHRFQAFTFAFILNTLADADMLGVRQ